MNAADRVSAGITCAAIAEILAGAPAPRAAAPGNAADLAFAATVTAEITATPAGKKAPVAEVRANAADRSFAGIIFVSRARKLAPV